MTTDVLVQRVSNAHGLPDDAQFQVWVDAALADQATAFALTIRIVDEAEGAALNRQYRQKPDPTNVLSFAADLPAEVTVLLDGTKPLGDLVLCAPVVEREAGEQLKAATDHWAHLTIHGVLHLLGHDHQQAEQAQAMEALECRILSGLGIDDPYQSR